MRSIPPDESNRPVTHSIFTLHLHFLYGGVHCTMMPLVGVEEKFRHVETTEKPNLAGSPSGPSRFWNCGRLGAEPNGLRSQTRIFGDGGIPLGTRSAGPPSHSYIEIGNLAGDPLCWYFWERAGLRSDDLMRVMPGCRDGFARRIHMTSK